MWLESVVWAQEAAQPAQQYDPKWQFIPLLLIALVMYFLLIRPTVKKQKNQREMVSHLKRGDEVWTTSGIYGIVEGVEEGTVKLRVSENTVIKILKSQVSALANKPTTSSANKTPK